MTPPIRSAMVLSAGLGMRMRPLTDTIPKPLVELAGRPLIDYVFSRLDDAGIERAIVNVHYLADSLEMHLKSRARPCVLISDERALLLDTGGGVKHALGLLGEAPFIVHNSDSLWIEGQVKNLENLIEAWDPKRMDSLLLVAPVQKSLGYDGHGDFHLDAEGRLARRAKNQTAPLVFAGVSILHHRLFDDTPDGPFSLNLIWDRAIDRGRLFGQQLDGQWMHIGTPQALLDAERWMADAAPAQT